MKCLPMDNLHELDLVPVLLVEVDAPEHGGLPVRLLQLLQDYQRRTRLNPKQTGCQGAGDQVILNLIIILNLDQIYEAWRKLNTLKSLNDLFIFLNYEELKNYDYLLM